MCKLNHVNCETLNLLKLVLTIQTSSMKLARCNGIKNDLGTYFSLCPVLPVVSIAFCTMCFMPGTWLTCCK